MKKIILSVTKTYSLILLLSLVLYGLVQVRKPIDFLFPTVFISLVIYFSISLFQFPRISQKWLRAFITLYSYCFSAIVCLALFLNVKKISDVIFIALFFPVFGYFILQISSTFKKKPHSEQKFLPIMEGEIIEANQVQNPENPQTENDRRRFFRILTSAGVGSLILYLIFPQRAEAAFFGSVPGPGTISIKDTSGTKIDPAIKSPTDGYGISNVDSTAYPFYYGFVNKDAAWYIMRENPENTFTYSKGNSSFATNWTNRASLTYDTFDVIF